MASASIAFCAYADFIHINIMLQRYEIVTAAPCRERMDIILIHDEIDRYA